MLGVLPLLLSYRPVNIGQLDGSAIDTLLCFRYLFSSISSAADDSSNYRVSTYGLIVAQILRRRVLLRFTMIFLFAKGGCLHRKSLVCTFV